MRGFLGYLESKAAGGDMVRFKSDLSRITEATDKMNRMIIELIDFSRVGNTGAVLEKIVFESLAQDAIRQMGDYFLERKTRVDIKEGSHTIYADRKRLLEVIQILLDNAARFMGDQSNPMITIGAQGEEDRKPIFFVRDNGIGIAPEYHERIFGLFNKLDARSECTGIGLALVKRIIEVHGGRIWGEIKVAQASN